LPNGDQSHCSNIIIQSWYANKNGSVYYEFHQEGAGPNAQLMYGAARLVKIHEERHQISKVHCLGVEQTGSSRKNIQPY
jgi:hypothetical protein